MKKAHLALSLLSFSFLAACGGAAAASAAGVYEVDKVALKATMLAGMPAEAQKEPKAMEMVDGMLKDMVMTVELKADGTAAMNMKMSMMGQTMEDSATGTWKLDGGKLTMVTKDKAGKEETKTVDYTNGSFMIEQDTGGQKVKVTFKRK
jgi:hypothetical protein